MMVEKMMMEGGAEFAKKATRNGIAGGAMRAEMKQEGKTEVPKATGKGIAGSHRRPSAESGSGGGGGGQAEQVAALKCQKLAEGDKAEAGKRKKIARVSQEYIDILLKEKATGTGAYKVSKSKAIAEKYKGPYDVLALVAQSNAIMEDVRAGDAKILEQYEQYGFAFAEVEEDNSFIYDEKIFGPIARSRPPVPQA